MRSLLPVLLTLFIVVLLGTGVDVSRAEGVKAGPEEVVAVLETTLIENMKAGESKSFEDRYATLRPLVEDIMAVEQMGRFLFGRDWAAFEPDERDEFKEAFLDLSAATYARQFEQFSGERFEPVDMQKQSEDRAVVKRELTTGKGRKIAFDYLMIRSDSGWQIVTIITDGVSDLAVKRSQYRRLLDTEGFDAIIARIRDSIESQRSV